MQPLIVSCNVLRVKAVTHPWDGANTATSYVTHAQFRAVRHTQRARDTSDSMYTERASGGREARIFFILQNRFSSGLKRLVAFAHTAVSLFPPGHREQPGLKWSADWSTGRKLTGNLFNNWWFTALVIRRKSWQQLLKREGLGTFALCSFV